jgi:secondary thiamine-phosphate synthase enzyme
MRQTIETIEISTTGRGFTEITDQVQSCLRSSGLSEGAVTLHVQHTSASLLIQENADPEVRDDFERFFSRICPDGDGLFQHTYEGPDDMPAHIRSALTCVNTTIPFQSGSMLLGTWQGIYLWEHRTHAHRRRVVLYFCGE